MSRSLRVDPKYIQKVNLALKRNGYPSQRKFAEHIVPSLSTVKNFLKGKPVDYENFREICERLGLDWQTITYIDVDVEPDEEVANPDQESREIETNSIEERYFKATSQFDSLEPLERKSRIQVLEEIAMDSPRYHWKVMEFLAAFVRENAPRKEEEEREEERSPKLAGDIQAALTVIGGRDSKKDPPNQRLNLSNTDIRGANLRDAKLQGADLFQADLQRANLIEANLQEAFLKKANLQQASLSQAKMLKADCQFANLQEAFLVEANLQEAVLDGANLQGAHLDRANLQKADLNTSKLQMADLRDTNLQEAVLQRAKLQGADLRGANLQEADLDGANLQGARLWRVNLRRAVLQYANLEGAQLWKANLEGTDFTDATNLTQQQIDESTRQDSTTILPDYLINQSSDGNQTE